MTREYSVLMSVYRNTQKDEFIQCVDSMLAQNPKPKEFIVVIDGNINSELRALIEDYVKKQIIIPVPLQQNVGLGNALRVGCEYCSCEWIARMNSDDIAAPDRIEKQFEYIDSHPDVDVLGGNIAEFNGNPDNAVSVRRVPQSHEDICSFMRERCPFNHMTVMIRKEAMNDAGGYKDWQFNEDGYLWVRMYLAGAKFANLDDILVYARIDDNSFMRRGGYKYYRSEVKLFRFMRKNKIIGWGKYLKAWIIRVVVQLLMPGKMRPWFFNTYARESASGAKDKN